MALRMVSQVATRQFINTQDQQHPCGNPLVVLQLAPDPNRNPESGCGVPSSQGLQELGGGALPGQEGKVNSLGIRSKALARSKAQEGDHTVSVLSEARVQGHLG